MSDKKNEQLTPAEWKIMKIIWSLKSCASRDVVEAAKQQEGWAPSTVKTLLRRLVDKGFLKTEQIGNCFLYSPAQTEQSSLKQFADNLLDLATEGTLGPVIAYLVRKSRLSPNEINQLHEILDKSKEKENL